MVATAVLLYVDDCDDVVADFVVCQINALLHCPIPAGEQTLIPHSALLRGSQSVPIKKLWRDIIAENT